jgi:predicted enzyme related to lactoylglutathione lyase
MPRPIHFEVHADDPERAIRFYTDVLGWNFANWGAGGMDYWVVTTGEEGTPGINGGMMRRIGPINGDSVIAYVCTVDVPDLDAYLEKAVAAGATLALPRMPIPGVGWLAYVKDTEGNLFGMMQADPAAK